MRSLPGKRSGVSNFTLNGKIIMAIIKKCRRMKCFIRSTDDFNGAQCKAVCVEAGMIALRRESSLVTHEDFLDAVIEVQAKKKANLNYYA